MQKHFAVLLQWLPWFFCFVVVALFGHFGGEAAELTGLSKFF
jgi:hypothetical protein